MRNLLRDPSFELGSGEGWTLTGGAAFYTPAGGDGSSAQAGVKVLGLKTNTGTTTLSTGTQAVTLQSGGNYRLRCYVKQLEATDANHALSIEFDKGNGVLTSLAALDSVAGSDWNLLAYDLPTTTGNSCRVKFNAGYYDVLDVGNQEWWVDTVSLMYRGSAVWLAERGIDALLAVLRADLADELANIDADRADSLVMLPPTADAFYSLDRPEEAGPRVQIAVYETDSYEFFNPYTDQDAQRSVYELPLTVAITFFPEAYGQEEAMRRLRRYVAAVNALILKSPTLKPTDTDGDPSIQSAVVVRVLPPRATDAQDPNRSIKLRAELQVLLRCEEVL